MPEPAPTLPTLRTERLTLVARMAEKIGFVMTGTAQDPEVGEVLVYEIGRP